MIKLIEKTMKVDPQTFQPLLYVTVAIPLEPVLETTDAKSKDELCMEVGQAFIEAVNSSATNPMV